MIKRKRDKFSKINTKISKERKAVKEISNLKKELEKTADSEEKRMIQSQINKLKNSVKRMNNSMKKDISGISLNPRKSKPIKKSKDKKSSKRKPKKKHPKKKFKSKKKIKSRKAKIEIEEFERDTLRRIKKERKKDQKENIKKKKKKASRYVQSANKLFSGVSEKLLKKGFFKELKMNLIKGNMQFLTKSYVSIILFNTFISFIASFIILTFFLFFNFGVMYPFITVANKGISSRIFSFGWILIVIPILTFFLTYFFPRIEKKSIENRISQELPFATINMASISESMIEPTNIFKIMVKTNDYPTLQKEFVKLLNEVNVFGKDLVSALRKAAFNNPSRKLAELFDGLATTITSGGDLSEFFEKRAQSLLFDYRIEKEKKTKSAETFMDIYISVVIAAPMILMLLLIMMRVSGLGISLSASMISLVMVLGVSFVNILFLIFLQLKSKT